MVLTPDEIADFWALGVPIEATQLPDDELTRAQAERRIQQALSWSCMGTAETYWTLVGPGEKLEHVRRDSFVVPPGQQAYETPFDDRLDDRDVVGRLWEPFWSEQHEAAIRSATEEQRRAITLEYARVLGALEHTRMFGRRLTDAETFVALLYFAGPIDVDALDTWLKKHPGASPRHLVHGTRARWLTHDLGLAFRSVQRSLERFETSAISKPTVRFDLIRFAVRVARGRAATPIDSVPSTIAVGLPFAEQLSAVIRSEGLTVDVGSLGDTIRDTARELGIRIR